MLQNLKMLFKPIKFCMLSFSMGMLHRAAANLVVIECLAKVANLMLSSAAENVLSIDFAKALLKNTD